MQAFLFERDFDQEIEAEARAGIVPEGPQGPDPVLIEAIRREAFEAGRLEGHAAGLQEGREEVAQSISAIEAEALAELLPVIEALRLDQARHQRAVEHDLARMVLALAEKLLPEVRAHFGPRRLEAFARRSLQLAEGDGGIDLYLPPEMLTRLAPRLSGATTATGAPLRLSADPSLAPCEARASWAKGSAEHAEEKLHDALLATLHTIAQDTAPDGN